MRPDDYLKTLTVSAELIAPDDAKKALSKPGVRAKVLKELEAENASEE